MGSGEGDAAETAKALLARSRSLDAFTRCSAMGCEVMVHLSGNGLCQAHGAVDGIPEYFTDSDSGAFIYARHVSINLGGDCE